MSKIPSIEKTVATIRRAVAKRPPEERMEWLLLATAKFAATARTATKNGLWWRKRYWDTVAILEEQRGN